MEAYERLIGDAMIGDASLFARQDGVEASWRVVDPILTMPTTVHEYEPGTWGPSEVTDINRPVRRMAESERACMTAELGRGRIRRRK